MKGIRLIAGLSLLSAIFVSGCGDELSMPIESESDDLSTALMALAPETKDYRERSELQFVVFGDSGTGGGDQYRVARAMIDTCKREGCDFAIQLGDLLVAALFWISTSDFRKKFERPYEGFGRFDIFAVPGNHDHWASAVGREIRWSRTSDRLRMLDRFYSIPKLPEWLTLFGIDTSKISDKQALRAQQALCSRPGWRILFGHHPIVADASADGYEFVKDKMLPVIRNCGVQFYFSGNEHIQEHIDNFYFHQIIQGAGGQTLEKAEKGGLGQFFRKSTYGFALVRVNASQIEIRFFNSSGIPIYLFRWTQADWEFRRRFIAVMPTV